MGTFEDENKRNCGSSEGKMQLGVVKKFLLTRVTDNCKYIVVFVCIYVYKH